MKHDKLTQAILGKTTAVNAWPFPTKGYDHNGGWCEPASLIEEDSVNDNVAFSYTQLEPMVTLTEEQSAYLADKVKFHPTDEQCDALVDGSALETDPHGKDLNSPGAKADAGKDRVWLFLAGFSNALEEVARVTTVGANKYTPDGWVDVPDGSARYMDAFGRHLLALGQGFVLDDGPKGTGCMHKAQMIWNLLASLELELRDA